MKRIAGLVIILAMVTLVAPALFAQEERGEVSVFADYVRLRSAHNTNFWGPGASLGFNFNNYVQMEAAMAYDPEKTFTQTNSSGIGTVTTTTTRQVGLNVLHGEFGPKFQTGFHSAKLYLVAKGGFIHFGVSNASIGTGFVNSFNNFDSSATHGVFYPGVGVEFGKRFGVKMEAGDLMYFNNGANHNLRVSVGPKISF
jgi:hypothetical protein